SWVLANGQSARAEGKWHREQTARYAARRASESERDRRPQTLPRPPAGCRRARVKRWGKSPPPVWGQTGHAKPPPEQDRIGGAARASGWPTWLASSSPG